MKKKLIIALALLCPAIHYAKYTAEEIVPEVLARQVLEHTNTYRISKGLAPVRWNRAVAQAATAHSMNMGFHIVGFGHDGFHERIKSLSKKPRASAENVFMGNMRGDRAQKCVDSWIDSPGHQKNLVGNYTDCGIGVYKNAEGYWYFTQIFTRY